MVKWMAKTISECADIFSGGTPRTTMSQYWDGGVLWCTPTDITKAKSKYLIDTSRTITDIGLRESAAVLLPVGTILLCSRATIGEMSIATKPTSTNQGFKNLICNENVHNEFLYYLLQTKVKAMLELAIGSTFLEISKKALSGIEISLPPLSEQRAIAAALSDVDGYIAALERLIAKKRNIKQGAMQELLTGKRRLPGFSGDLVEKTLGDVLKVGHGKSQYEIITVCGRYPILATGGEIGRTNSFLYDKPSVLIGRKGTIDKPRYVDTPFWTIDTLFYTIINDDVCPKYLYYLFCIVDWASLNEASGVPSLSSGTIERVQVVLPTKAEQTAIAATLSDMDSEIDALTAKLNKVRDIKQGMMQELLTGRIRLVECGSVLPLSKRRQAAALQTEARYE